MAASLSEAVTHSDISRAALAVIRESLEASAGSLSILRDDGSIETLGNGEPEGVPRGALHALPLETRMTAADAIRTERPVYIETQEEYGRIYPEMALSPMFGCGTRAAIPIFGRGRAIGSINLGFATWRPIAEPERRLLRVVADECGRALERTLTFDTEPAVPPHAERELLFRLSEAANRAHDVGQLYEPSLDAMISGLNVDRAAILLRDPDGVMRFKAWHRLSDRYRAAVEGHSPWAADERDAQPITVHDVTSDGSLASFRDLFASEGIAALAFIPLVHQSKLLGKFMLYCNEPRCLSERDLKLAMSIASQVSLAVARTSLVERVRRLQNVTSHLSQALEPSKVARIILDEGTSALAATRSAIWMLDAAGKQLELVASRGHEESGDTLSCRPVVREDPIGAAVLRGKAMWSNSAAGISCIPLVFEGKVMGALSFGFADPRRLDMAERSFLVTLAQHAAQAMERARLFAEERAARTHAEEIQSRTAFLFEASVVLASSLDFRATLDRVARLAVPRMADWCTVDYASSTSEPTRMAIAHVDPSKVELAKEIRRRFPTPPSSRRGIQHVIRSGEPQLYEEVTDQLLVEMAQSPEHLALMRQVGLHSVMIVPMTARGRTFGAISFVSAESGRRYGPADLAMAEILARRAGVAIDNALLYEAEACSRQQAERASRAREDVLAVVSHDLRNPLSAILLSASSMLAMDIADRKAPRIRKNLETISRSAERMARMIGDLLDLASIQTGRLTVERSPESSSVLVREAIEMFSALAEERRLRLEPAVAPHLPPVYCDRDRALQVLSNLISNAVKVTAAGGVIEVGSCLAGDEIHFWVKDSGPGIEPDELPHIFERYWRGRAGGYQGVGLGLAIARGLVEAHGGRIWAESTPGVGSRFAFALPLAPGPDRSRTLGDHPG